MPFKVSVAIITYNQSNLLGLCIKSILKQDFNDYEIVVADDCSTDDTPKLLLQLQSLYPDKIKIVLSDKNAGITANSNKALNACTGKYIAWMGGDDLMLPNKLRIQVDFMESNPDCVISYHDLDVFDSATGETLRYFNSGNGSQVPYEGGVETVVRYGTFMGACSTMILRDRCPRDGFDHRIPIASDWLYYIETLVRGGEIKYISQVLGRYRRHNNNITSLHHDRYFDQLLTLAIVENKYPFLSKFSRLYRSRYLYSVAVTKLLSGEYSDARHLLLESIRQGWVCYKWLWWFTRCCLHK